MTFQKFYSLFFQKLYLLYCSIAVLIVFLGAYSPTLANSQEVEISFAECVGTICQPISRQNTTYAFTQPLSAGEKIKIGIFVDNPQRKNIYSVESWLQFDPQKISISNLSSEKSAFSLEAPGEFTIEESSGLIKIGRAIAGAPVSKTKNFLASFEVTAKQNTANTTLNFVDYRASDVGKTSVLTIQNMIPQNILYSKPKDLMFSSTGGASVSHNAPNQYSNPASGQIIQNGTNVYGVQNGNTNGNNTSNIPSFISIPRPTGLRTRTYLNGKIEHIWKMGSDPRISGYYLYYSTTSGKYMHRRDIGKTNVSQFPADFFEKGKRIYFAVQAYDRSGKISDFSDETYVTVGVKGSESHPFFEQIFPNIKLDSQKKAYRTINGKQISGKDNSQYSANLSQKFPKRNTQSGNSFPLIILSVGLILCFLAFQRILFLQKQKKRILLIEKKHLLRKFKYSA